MIPAIRDPALAIELGRRVIAELTTEQEWGVMIDLIMTFPDNHDLLFGSIELRNNDANG